MHSSVGRPRRPSQDSRGFAHNGWPMTAFADFTTLCVELVRTASRLGKRRLVAEFLRTLPADEVTSAVAFMTGRPFPVSDPRVLNVRGLPAPARDPGSATGHPLTTADVEAAFVGVAEAGGAGARRLKDQRLTALAARASDAEREVIGRIIGGEMRTGVSDGLVLEAIAEAAGADLARTRRAALFIGDLATVAALALTGGPDALAAGTPRLFVPMLPMLAEITSDFGEALSAHAGAPLLRLPRGRGALAHRRAVGAAMGGIEEGDGRPLSGRARGGDDGERGGCVSLSRAGRRPRGRDGQGPARGLRARRARQALVQAEGRGDGRLRDHRGRPRVRPPRRLALQLSPGRARRGG